MVDLVNFKLWLSETQKYSPRTISNIVSRFKRADLILPWFDNPIYNYQIEQESNFKLLSCDIKSQIKKSIKLYFDFEASKNKKNSENRANMKVLSLFSNIGVAEAYLKDLGFDVVIANELVPRRAALYSKIYPHTNMICGDITNPTIIEKLSTLSIEKGVDVILATPPCQGMSTAGQQKEDDVRNSLIVPVVKIVKTVKPRYVVIENVPMLLNTMIEVDGTKKLITDYLKENLGDLYKFEINVINTKNYSVPQNRERAIILLSKNGEAVWKAPKTDEKVVTLMDAIGNLPILDPFVTDLSKEEMLRLFPHYYERAKVAEEISVWHKPPQHIYRQVLAMQHTPTGCTAFDNEIYFPVKEDGTPVKGYHNTYKRQNWDTPAYTVTMDNRKISSQNNVHPGRLEYVNEKGENIYSDARTLTLYELMIVTSLPCDWPIPQNTSEAFLRRIIGEGIPPLFVKKLFSSLKEVANHE